MTDPAAQVIQRLESRGLTLATCESLTGGGIGAALTSVPGASKVFRGGLITYASDLKTRLAGVDADWIGANGVINAETAIQMADGATAACQADVAVAVTGVAGPDPEDGVSPGRVWIGLAIRGRETVAKPYDFSGNRDAIRMATVSAALQLILDALD
jgi:nicotinamide-nucleotide amidase